MKKYYNYKSKVYVIVNKVTCRVGKDLDNGQLLIFETHRNACNYISKVPDHIAKDYEIKGRFITFTSEEGDIIWGN